MQLGTKDEAHPIVKVPGESGDAAKNNSRPPDSRKDRRARRKQGDMAGEGCSGLGIQGNERITAESSGIGKVGEGESGDSGGT